MDSVYATILLLGLAIGILYKTYVPFQQKMKAGTIDRFNPTYIWTAIVAFVGAVMSALAIFPDAAMAWAEGWPFGTGYAAVFVFGFFWAVGWNYGANSVFKPRPESDEVHEKKEARLI